MDELKDEWEELSKICDNFIRDHEWLSEYALNFFCSKLMSESIKNKISQTWFDKNYDKLKFLYSNMNPTNRDD